MASNAICELLLAPTVTEASATAEEQHGCLFNYADNFLVLARTREEAAAIVEVLGVSLRRNPAGLLRLKSPRIRRVDYGFDFLGYTFRRRMGTVTARPTREKLEEVRDRYWLKRIEHRHRGWRLPSGHLERSIRSFRAQYPLWGNAGLAWQHNLLSALDELRSCPAAAARDLGHVLSRALKIAGDNGVLSYIRVSCGLRENARLIACTVQVAKPGADEVITVTRHGRE